MLALLALVVLTAEPVPPAQDPHAAAQEGDRLSADDARALERRLLTEPGDLETRTRLLGYYFLRSHRSAADRKSRQSHVLWIIKNRPESQVAGLPYASLDPTFDGESYYDARTLWLEAAKLRSADTAVLGNAAEFLLLHDRSSSERLLLQAAKQEPDRAEWSQKLAQLHSLALFTEDEPQSRRERAAKALTYHERALDLLDAEARGAELPDAAKAAFESGDHEKARTWASEMVNLEAARPGWNRGNALHHGHLILGRLALRDGDVEAARQHLLQAGRTPGSPQLDSFGPNMTLAKELLLKGEKAVVLEYFGLCASFWKGGAEKLKVWAEAVRNGAMPDFGANLSY